MGMAPVKLLQVPGRRLVMAGPSLVTAAYVRQLGPAGLGGAQELQLLLQDVVLATPHLMQVDLVNHAPAWAVRSLGGLLALLADAGQLPEVARKDQGRHLVGRLPHLDDALKVGLRQLGDLVHGHHVVLRQAVHHFHGIPVEEEGAGTGVNVCL